MGFRAAVLAAALLLNLTAQPLGVLRITVTIVDADGRARPVPRHALLISANPSSAAPRRAITALDGTAEVHLRPGNYTVESDEPLIFRPRPRDIAPAVVFLAGPDAAWISGETLFIAGGLRY